MLGRKTIIKSSLLNILKQTKAPISVPQILQQLAKKKLNPNKTTIYRILEKLVKNQEVSEISVKNKPNYYELFKQECHHFICNHCDVVRCFDDIKLDKTQFNFNRLLSHSSVQIQSHEFNVYGICESCASN
tara:strand:+ start:489 stop:881 length:393 start_codon:yes stop_codon:yes gene_type:complete